MKNQQSLSHHSFHKNFQLNGHSFATEKELLDYASTNEESIVPFLEDWFSSNDFLHVQTSGSTGKPKQIQLQKQQMQNSAIATGNYFNLFENTSALLCLSPDYIAGKMMLVRALTLGWQLDVVPPTSKVQIAKTYDFSAMVPMQVENSLNELQHIKKLIVGGGVVSNELQTKLAKSSTEVFATYGMTETITHIAVKRLNNITQKPNFYEVLPNVKIYRDQRNCLVIEAPQVSNELVITNDVVQLISNTKFEWLGRFDNVINSGGVKLHPEKIEEKLATIINENRFFVAGVSDALLGEKLVLVIEGLEVDKSIKTEIQNLTSLSKYEIPKDIFFVDEFIETETKKIQRAKTLVKIFPK